MLRDSFTMSRERAARGRMMSGTTSQYVPDGPDEIAEVPEGKIPRAKSDMNLEQDEVQDEAAQEAADQVSGELNYNEPDQFPNHSRERAQTGESKYYQQNDYHHHHHNLSHHAPTCSAAKLVNAELAMNRPGAHCSHSNRAGPQATQQIQQQHKPSCMMHRFQWSPGGGRRLFRADPRNPAASQMFRLRNRQTKQLLRLNGDRTNRLLLAEHHHRPRPMQPPGSGSAYANNATDSGKSIDFRPLIRRDSDNNIARMTATSKSGTAASSQPNGRRTTIKFISQLYFLLHLSAMISLLMHHKNLVSNERRSIEPTVMQISGQNYKQFHTATRRQSPSGDQPLSGISNGPAMKSMPVVLLVSSNQSAPLPWPKLPVPLTLRFNHPSEWPQTHVTTQTVASKWQGPTSGASGRMIRSSASEEGQFKAIVDARSSDILVRLVGRLHAKCALQYFLCYLLLGSILALLLMWLTRVCDSSRAASYMRPDERAGREHHFRSSARQDCTPVLIGSISLGLIQLIVIGLEIADGVDWLLARQSGDGRPLDSAGEFLLECRWPIVLPLLQFVFVSLLMQFILAMVARNRNVVEKLPSSLALSPPPPPTRRNSSVSLQNIALAHLLVTHILLWLMKLNSIGLFQVPAPTFAPFVVLPPEPPALMSEPMATTSTTSTSPRPTTTTTTSSTTSSPTTIAPGAKATSQVAQSGGEAAEKRPPPNVQPTSLSEQTPVQATGANVARQLERLKIERDLRSAAERRPLSPLAASNLRPSTSDELAQVRGVAAEREPKLGPAPVRRDPQIGFKSSLAKRKTAFRQAGPSERLNLTALARPISVAQTEFPPPPLPSTRAPASGATLHQNTGERSAEPKPRQKHRVRIIVHRDRDSPSQSIDLADNEPDLNPAPATTTERPFPSVDDDPPPRSQTAASNMVELPNAGSSPAPDITKVLKVRGGKSRSLNIEGPQNATEPTSEPVDLADDEDEEDTGDSEPDLDSLLPPVPSYNETENELTSQSEPTSQEMAPLGATTQGPIDDDEHSFAFTEAATIQVLHVVAAHKPANSTTTTAKPMAKPTATQLEGIKPEALFVNRQDLDQFDQAQTRQPTQQQPSFTDFLMPIVQQYHILVLTILFNMWLDSMQRREVASETTKGQSGHNSTRATTRPRHSSSSASSSELSPTSSSVDRFDSSSLSIDSSRRHLVGAIETARQRSRSIGDHLKRAAKANANHLNHNFHIGPDLSPISSSCQRERARRVAAGRRSAYEATSSACSIFFGLLVVSGALIVILLSVDLLSLLVQCLIQLLSIVFCLIGMCLVWRLRKGAQVIQTSGGHTKNRLSSSWSQTATGGHHQSALLSHKSSFHYLFLLAAYYCGISIALNLDQQHQLAHLFPIPVIQFIQRWFQQQQQHQHHDAQSSTTPMQTVAINCQFLFYCAISLKGLILIVQVTIQTILIRSSCFWPEAQLKLRQIFTFLMFTNLSLWALEIRDQQQQVQLARQTALVSYERSQQQQVWRDWAASSDELLSLEGFTRFASSVVTLSHLYHGLVFMKH